MEEAPTNRRVSFSLRRFSLKQFLLLFVIVAFVIAAWVERTRPQLDNKLRTTLTAKGFYWISWGTKNDKLQYVVFLVGPRFGSLDNPIQIQEYPWEVTAKLLKPDGSQIELDGHKQQFEIVVEGQYRESDERVTLKQFNAFMNSNPDEYTIERLVEFARSHK